MSTCARRGPDALRARPRAVALGKLPTVGRLAQVQPAHRRVVRAGPGGLRRFSAHTSQAGIHTSLNSREPRQMEGATKLVAVAGDGRRPSDPDRVPGGVTIRKKVRAKLRAPATMETGLVAPMKPAPRVLIRHFSALRSGNYSLRVDQGGLNMATRETDFKGDESGLTILGALAQLRDDLDKLQEENSQKGRTPLFQIEEGELELKLVAKRDVKAEGKGHVKFRLWVADAEVGAGGSGSTSTERLQTLKIKFKGLVPKSPNDVRGIGLDNNSTPPSGGATFKVAAPKTTRG